MTPTYAIVGLIELCALLRSDEGGSAKSGSLGYAGTLVQTCRETKPL
jgi:hypothetical protein